MELEYIGTELELFESAHIWKKYWFDILEPYTGMRILDVGAGIGATASMFSAKELDFYLAVEPDPENIRVIQEKVSENIFTSTFQYKSGDIGVLAEKDRFDTILYIDVLEHILDDRGELEAVSKYLLPGGRIIIVSPAHQWLFSPFDKSVGHFRRYNKKSLLLAKPDKLAVERICYVDSVGILASAANRLLLRRNNPNRQQIKIWNDYMVPISRHLDKFTRYTLGKSIIGIFQLL